MTITDNLQIGITQVLKAIRQMPQGWYLADAAGREVLLPKKFTPENFDVDSLIEVFVYNDSEDRLVCTTQKPYGMLNEFVGLKVVSRTSFGAFLDWGLDKDLLVPENEQHKPMRIGEVHVVRIAFDKKSDRLIGIGKLFPFVEKENIALEPEQQVMLLPYEKTDLGIMCLIDNKYLGMLYKNECFQEIEIGKPLEGFVKKVREDKKIDLSLRKDGFDGIVDQKEEIIKALIAAGGSLPIGDKSPPEQILEYLPMSKKTFKKLAGNLYREKRITISKTEIKLIKEA
ncbi:MAG: GntR family transcriptional regulator [Bernardetiaceae bacterium]|nr:GntR family transcriptional regulator [Bernardetiaceae bacterium]